MNPATFERKFDLNSLRQKSLQFGLSGALLLMTSPVMAQSFFDLFKKGEGNPFAPVDSGVGLVPHNLTITPTNPDDGSVKKELEVKDTPKAVPAKDSKAKDTKAKETKANAALANPGEEDEDEDALYEYEKPRRVTVVLPLPRPGATVRNAADVAPIGSARWNAGKEQLPPGVNFQQAVAFPSVGLPGSTLPSSTLPGSNLPGSTRVASLPQTQNTPRWSSSDIQPLRPSGLRESESPVANMPGVYAPPDANFQCLPVGVKQVLIDAAKRFGHVAILNAKRPRGTGARQSYHYQCRAVDFRVRGVAVRTVYNFLKEHPNVGGRKIYPFGFFHIDDGPVRSW